MSTHLFLRFERLKIRMSFHCFRLLRLWLQSEYKIAVRCNCETIVVMTKRKSKYNSKFYKVRY